jgi:hypothetical protein
VFLPISCLSFSQFLAVDYEKFFGVIFLTGLWEIEKIRNHTLPIFPNSKRGVDFSTNMEGMKMEAFK